MPQTLPSVPLREEGGREKTVQNDTARARLATYDKNICPQCSGWLLAPDWSEYLNERCVRHSWSCEVCGYEFETAVFFSRRAGGRLRLF